jgi:hypothetical protein
MVLNFHEMRHYAVQFNSAQSERFDDCLGQVSSPSDARWLPLISYPDTTRPRQCDRATRRVRLVDRRCTSVARRNGEAASCSKVVALNSDAVARGDAVVPRIDDAFFPGEIGGCSERRHRCAKGRIRRCERRTRRPHRCCRGSS